MFESVKEELRKNPKVWLVTGAAGFIGSNLCHTLLDLGQKVRGLDNLSTGLQENIDELLEKYSSQFQFLKGDLLDLETCHQACEGVDYVSHQGALGSVPRSIEDPIASHSANVTGTLNMFWAAHGAGVKRVVYASSSSVFGDSPKLPKTEDDIGKPLSPYAATKFIDEIYADIFNRCYSLSTIGLRYFNVFGPRQRPDGPYAAVIPRWVDAMAKGDAPEIYGDGETSRDFCFIDNVVQINILSATTENTEAQNQVYNVSVGQQMTLNQLYSYLKECLTEIDPQIIIKEPVYKDFRPGDIRHSKADVSKAKKLLGYEPNVNVLNGLKLTLPHFLNS